MRKKHYFILWLVVLSSVSIIGHLKSINFNLYFGNLHEAFAKFFVNGINTNISHPLWGYGFIRAFIKNPILVVLIQHIFLIFIVVKYSEYIKEFYFKSYKYFVILISLALPLFFFHTQLWPKSFSSNFFLLGVLYQLKFVKERNLYTMYLGIFLSSLSLHFRADYYFLIHILIILYSVYLKNYKFFIIAFSIVHLTILPWSLYNVIQNNYFIETSSNAGHVLVLGLGQYPSNKWKITPKDGDQTFIRIIQDKFGSDAKSTDYLVDKFLKKTFIEFVFQDPLEWMKKCLYSFKLLFLDPFYVGNLGDFRMSSDSYIKDLRLAENAFYSFNFLKSYNLLLKVSGKLSFKSFIILVFTSLSKVIGYLIFYVSLILVLIKLKHFKNISLIIMGTIILYQLAISIFVFHMPVYNTSIYLIYLILTSILYIEKKEHKINPN